MFEYFDDGDNWSDYRGDPLSVPESLTRPALYVAPSASGLMREVFSHDALVTGLTVALTPQAWRLFLLRKP